MAKKNHKPHQIGKAIVLIHTKDKPTPKKFMDLFEKVSDAFPSNWDIGIQLISKKKIDDLFKEYLKEYL